MLRPYYIPSWVYFLIGAAIAVALFFGIYSFAYLESIPQFIGVSNAESGDNSEPGFSSILTAGCTTKEVGIQTKKFKGTTTIAVGCPDSRNVCSEFICNDERICEEVLVSNATCSEDFDCDLFERCDTVVSSSRNFEGIEAIGVGRNGVLKVSIEVHLDIRHRHACGISNSAGNGGGWWWNVRPELKDICSDGVQPLA